MLHSNLFLTHVYAFAFGVLAAVLPADARQMQQVSAKPPAVAPQRPQEVQRGQPMPKPGGNVRPFVNRDSKGQK